MIRIDNELQELFKSRSTWASEIISGILWLGSGRDAQNYEKLIENDIKYVLNVSDDVPNFFENLQDGIKYEKLNVGDFGTDEGISRVFPIAFLFLNRALENEGRVLIHCACGANRSPTIVLAWLMHSKRMTLSEAWCIVKAKRKGIFPLQDNRRQLWIFEASIHDRNSYPTEDDFLFLNK